MAVPRFYPATLALIPGFVTITLLEEELVMENGTVADVGRPCKEPGYSMRHYELDTEGAQKVRSTGVAWVGKYPI